MSYTQGAMIPAEQEASTSDDYYTPRWVFDRMALQFDLDVAAPPGGISWIPADRSLSMADDGLSAEWHGRVWMNPPFSRPAPWVERFVDHGHGVALLPFAKSAWFDRAWSGADSIVALPSAFKFSHPTTNGSIPTLCGLFAIGDECREAIARVCATR